MTPERLASLPKWAVAFDCETHLGDPEQPGLKAPPLVCASVAIVGPDGNIVGELLDKEHALQVIIELLEDERRVIVGANIVYDILVCAVEWAKRGRDIMPLIFRAYEQGRIYDVLIGEALNAIADGTLGKDPRTGGGLRDPITGQPNKYYSLAIVTDLRLGRKDAKANDEFRMKYATLDGIPIELWPPAAREYPVDDVRNTLEDCLAQVGHWPSCGRHRWARHHDHTLHCEFCHYQLDEANEADVPGACWAPRPARNLHSMADQAYTAWAMHLGAAWGFDVDQDAVTKVVEEVEETRAAIAPRLIELGYLKWKREKGEMKLGESKSRVAHDVAAAYGANAPCPHCKGLGKVVSPSKKMPVRRAWDPEKDGINCTECCGTGWDLSTAPDLPRTEPSDKFPCGQVKADADTLNEASDDRLRMLADYKEDAKTVTNYGPYLRRARKHFPGGGWASVPLTLWPNVLLETDRTSYSDAIQQFPRDGGLRACIRARKGYVLCSCDYNQGEVITHAQSCLWILGHSRQAEMVLSGREPHSEFGAAVLGVDYDEFFAKKKKVKAYANARQAAKPWVFGKPGGMGAVKLVLQQRKQGPDTPCANGPVMIGTGEKGPDGKEIKVPGYRGLRFCVLMDGAEACGVDKVTSWGKPGFERRISPTCRRCLVCAERLQQQYFETFPEAKEYFKFTSMVVDEGQPLTDEQCAVHGLPPGSQLEPGEMIQHVSNIIRGGVAFCDASNGYFQSLLAVASKRALRIAQRECCDVTVRVPTDACPGGKVSKYAGQVSPLLGSRCIVLQHDEIIAEMPERIAHEAAERLSEIMVRAFQEVCPDMAAKCKAPPALMRRWLKQAEPCFARSGNDKPADESDRLIPWDDRHEV